jgi:eukaryotic-like serine/threonine-protein kinase
MAMVFLARDVALGRNVALKVATAGPEGDLDRIRREAQLAASLEHPNIVAVHAVGDGDGLAWFAMQYIKGRTLETLLAEHGPLAPQMATTVLGNIADALAYAHQRGVIHRDIKPANVMITEEGRTVVADFGIARTLGQPGMTTTGVLIGSPNYMAPEQFNGESPQATIDQYALGCLAFEVLSGQLPFPGDDVASVLKGHLLTPVPSLRALNPDVPDWLAALVERLLAKEAADRYPSMDVVRDLLREEGRSPSVTAVRVGERPTMVRAQSNGSDSTHTLRYPVSIVTVLLAGALLVVWFRGYSETSTTALEDSTTAPASVGAVAALGGVGSDSASGARGSEAPPTIESTRPVGRSETSTIRLKDTIVASAPSSADSQPLAEIDQQVAHVIIGSRQPSALLFLNDKLKATLGERNVPVTLPVAPGRYQLSIRFDGCLSWDTLLIIGSGDSVKLTRTPRCSPNE